MKNVLITGFGPFLEHAVNPSQLIVEALRDSVIAGARVTALVLPVEFGEDARRVLPAIDELRPDVVLEFGLRSRGAGVDIEMFAINHRAHAGDAVLSPILPDTPAAYFATIDPGRVANAISERTGAPAKRNGYAGSYLCNHVFYQTLHYTASLPKAPKIGFVHVPYASEHVSPGSDNVAVALPIETLIEAARVAIETSVEVV